VPGVKLRVLLYETPTNPYYNLAFEEAFFLVHHYKGGDPVLRIWRNENAVVIGIFQRAEEEVDLDYAEKEGIAVVRRFTGGGAVYHDLGNANYAIAVKTRSEDKIGYAYGFLLQGAVKALSRLGAEAWIENVNDVVVSHRKISGSAAAVRGDTVLLHGTLLISTDLEKLYRVLKVSKKKLEDKGVSSVKYRVGLLEELLSRKISLREVVEAFTGAFAELLGAAPYFDLPSKLELAIARALYEEKYSKQEWNLQRASTSMYRNLYSYIEDLLTTQA